MKNINLTNREFEYIQNGLYNTIQRYGEFFNDVTNYQHLTSDREYYAKTIAELNNLLQRIEKEFNYTEEE